MQTHKNSRSCIATVWERWDPETQTWQHNHLSSGFEDGNVPRAKVLGQEKLWGKAQWRKRFVYINNNDELTEFPNELD